jgi:serine/threonine-protein kinase RsbW
MEKAFRLLIGADIKKIPGVSARLENEMGTSGFTPDEILDIQLAVEEVITNVIVHGYRGRGGEIEITCRISGDRAVIRIADTAPPFDPLSLAGPDISADVEDRKVGGLGVYLVRQVTDGISYRRENGKNILELEKKRSS